MATVDPPHWFSAANQHLHEGRSRGVGQDDRVGNIAGDRSEAESTTVLALLDYYQRELILQGNPPALLGDSQSLTFAAVGISGVLLGAIKLSQIYLMSSF